MYQLYYYPLNASMAPHFVLEEMGVDYELILVDRKSNAQKSIEYMALNPTGRIPTLIDDGLVVFESAAICLHLCDKNQESKLIPSIGDPDRPLFYQWLMYLNNTVQAELMIYFYPNKHTTNSESASAIVEVQEARISSMFEMLNNELENKEFLVGNSFSVCDCFLFMLAIWADEFVRPPLSFPNLSNYLRRLAIRPSIVKVCDKENFSLEDYR